MNVIVPDTMVFLVIALLVPLATAIWPQPSILEHGDGLLWMSTDTEIRWYKPGRDTGSVVMEQLPFRYASDQELTLTKQPSAPIWCKVFRDPSSHDGQTVIDCEPSEGDDIVEHAIKTAWNTIFDHGLQPWKFHPRNWSEPQFTHDSSTIILITIKQLHHDPPNIKSSPTGSIDESYTIDLAHTNHIRISANSSVGIAHALTTMTQLFYKHTKEARVYTPFVPLHIFDTPAFPHRGINLDVSRHFFPIPDIKRQIDAAAYNKMNRFHLHVTDGQSWPLEIPALSELAAKGAYRPDLVYSVADFDDLQRYAAVRGVQLITEIDMPGHTSSIAHAYPELIAAFEQQPNWENYAAEPPSGTLKLNSENVDAFLDTLFEDLLPRVEKYTGYFHTGGDEVNMHAYTLDETVKSGEFDVLKPLMQRFVERNHERVRKQGMTPVVWEEMLVQWGLDLGEDVVVQSWRSDEAVRSIVEKGHKALVGNYKYWYLDCGKGQWLNFDPSVSSSYWPYNDYCAPFHNWRLAYSYDPLSGIPREHHHLVIGGEAHMWAEQTDPVNVDQMIWPRGSAVAEILWSGAKDEDGKNRSQIEASPRLSEMRERLVLLGVGAEPIQMPYCTMEGTVCQLGWKR